MEFWYLIIFGLGGFWVYWSIKNEGILWIPRVIVNIGGFALWGYLTFTQYGKIDNKFFQLIAIAGTMIVFVLVALPINEMLDKETVKRLGKEPYTPKKPEDDFTEEELQVGREIAEKLEQRIRDNVEKEMEEKEEK